MVMRFVEISGNLILTVCGIKIAQRHGCQKFRFLSGERGKDASIFSFNSGGACPAINVNIFIVPFIAEDGLRTTPCSQNSLNALAIDELLEYTRLALDGEMQAWVDAIDSLEVW